MRTINMAMFKNKVITYPFKKISFDINSIIKPITNTHPNTMAIMKTLNKSNLYDVDLTNIETTNRVLHILNKYSGYSLVNQLKYVSYDRDNNPLFKVFEKSRIYNGNLFEDTYKISISYLHELYSKPEYCVVNPYVKGKIQYLKDIGFLKFGITSNNDKITTNILLDKLYSNNINPDIIIQKEYNNSFKYKDIKPFECVHIGSHICDIIEANNYGCLSIGLLDKILYDDIKTNRINMYNSGAQYVITDIRMLIDIFSVNTSSYYGSVYEWYNTNKK